MAVLGRCIRADDPRDALERAKRRELVEFAHMNGMTDITENMNCDDYKETDGRVVPGIRTLLRQRGFTRIPVPNRQLGRVGRQETVSMKPKPEVASAPTATSDEWAEFQEFKRWKAGRQQAAAPSPPPPPEIKRARPPKYPDRLKPRPPQEINLLRDECKRLGIKMDRRDGKEQLKAKIAAAKATDGQNPPQLRQ